jgi:hypothetical protein
MKNRFAIHRVRLISPWLTIALLMGMSLALPNRSQNDPHAAARRSEIAAAIREAPFFIGRWVGEDATHMIPREAQTLLHPNAILSRTYRSPAGSTVHVLLVHCSDARDMIGHYPPVCYPSTGWIQAPAEPQTAMVAIGQQSIPVRHYVFQRYGERAKSERIRILNAFVLPDGHIALDIDDLNRQSERLAFTVQGVAQLQVIAEASMDLTEIVESASEILNGMPEVFEKLNVGEENLRET